MDNQSEMKAVNHAFGNRKMKGMDVESMVMVTMVDVCCVESFFQKGSVVVVALLVSP